MGRLAHHRCDCGNPGIQVVFQANGGGHEARRYRRHECGTKVLRLSLTVTCSSRDSRRAVLVERALGAFNAIVFPHSGDEIAELHLTPVANGWFGDLPVRRDHHAELTDQQQQTEGVADDVAVA